MSDAIVTVFRLHNERGYWAPTANVTYQEQNTGIWWNINCGGRRAYVARVTPKKADAANEAADSHFMVRRLTCALLMGGVGLFEAEAVGRLTIPNVGSDFTWSCEVDVVDPSGPVPEAGETVYDWLKALCAHTVLRRAIEDAHLAISQPHESLVFVYRGLEWIVRGLPISWDDLAVAMGVSKSELRGLKRAANDDTGIRHATLSGRKLRAQLGNYGSWVCGLLDAVMVARARLDKSFEKPAPDAVARIVFRAIWAEPFP